VRTLRGALPPKPAPCQAQCADSDGFCLHTAVCRYAADRKQLERACRCIARPTPSDERAQGNTARRVSPRPTAPWRDGTTHLVTPPPELLRPLPAPVLRPRLRQAMTASQPGILRAGLPLGVEILSSQPLGPAVQAPPD